MSEGTLVFPTTPKVPLTNDPKTLILYAKPKQGKTTVLSLLPNNLLIDLENGSDHVGGLTIKVGSFEELTNVITQLEKQGVTYPYITLDTTTALEEIASKLATILYKKTPMGKNFDPDGDVKKLANGAG